MSYRFLKPKHYIKQYANHINGGRKYGHTGEHTIDCIRAQAKIAMSIYLADFDWQAMHLSDPKRHSFGSTDNIDELIRKDTAVEVYEIAEKSVNILQFWHKGKGHCVALVHQNGEVWVYEATPEKYEDDWVRPVKFEDYKSKEILRMARLLYVPELMNPELFPRANPKK